MPFHDEAVRPSGGVFFFFWPLMVRIPSRSLISRSLPSIPGILPVIIYSFSVYAMGGSEKEWRLLLTDSIHWLLKVRSSAARASTWAGEATSVFKHISTCEARGRPDNHLFSLGCYRACNVREMLINFFFPNSHRLGEFPGTHIIFA